MNAPKDFREHWWNELLDQENIKWLRQKGNLMSGDLNGARIKTGKLPFGEILLEVDYKTGSESQKTLPGYMQLSISESRSFKRDLHRR